MAASIKSMVFKEPKSTGIPSRGFLDGQLLIATPGMADPRFDRSVVYVCAHSADGAMGIVVNQTKPDISFADLLRQLEIISDGEDIMLPRDIDSMRVHVGGPVETGRGFVLHSSDWFVENSTLPIGDEICLTATLDILRAIARGRGPTSSLLALGYAGWGPSQLEKEIQANGWLNCPADPQIVFGNDAELKYHQALHKLGVDPVQLAPEAGHA